MKKQLSPLKFLGILLSMPAALVLVAPPAANSSDAATEGLVSARSAIPSPSHLNRIPPTLELPSLGSADQFLPEQSVKLVLRLQQRRVYLYQDDQVAASYPVAVGKPGWETPTGKFRVMHKVVNPVFENPFNGVVTPPGPGNPLGDRLIVFAKVGNKGYAGFHGTTNEALIGQAVSHGCVRMKNKDIRALFERIHVGTTVIVTHN
uniref:ErfK/YbiS/YcfS/YnhG family protein n=1 Tax=Cyanothece sp. (strain PCC 7425 / ATCC 29141) TaxID=395961 RepID=B8HNW0_CYAP4